MIAAHPPVVVPRARTHARAAPSPAPSASPSATPGPLHASIALPNADPLGLARRELSVPGRYRTNVRVTAPQTWWERLANWVFEKWRDLADAVSRRIHIGPSSQVAIGDAIVFAVLLGIAFVAARLLASFVSVAGTRVDATALEAQKSAHALALQAAAAAEAGDYARAIRTIFVAAVTLLDLRGVVRDDASATVGDLRRAVRARSVVLEPPFAELARTYSATAYAELPADRDGWGRAHAAYQALVREAAGA